MLQFAVRQAFVDDAQLPHVQRAEIHGDEAIGWAEPPGKAVDGGREEAIGDGQRRRTRRAAIRDIPRSRLRKQPKRVGGAGGSPRRNRPRRCGPKSGGDRSRARRRSLSREFPQRRGKRRLRRRGLPRLPEEPQQHPVQERHACAKTSANSFLLGGLFRPKRSQRSRKSPSARAGKTLPRTRSFKGSEFATAAGLFFGALIVGGAREAPILSPRSAAAESAIFPFARPAAAVHLFHPENRESPARRGGNNRPARLLFASPAHAIATDGVPGRVPIVAGVLTKRDGKMKVAILWIDHQHRAFVGGQRRGLCRRGAASADGTERLRTGRSLAGGQRHGSGARRKPPPRRILPPSPGSFRSPASSSN